MDNISSSVSASTWRRPVAAWMADVGAAMDCRAFPGPRRSGGVALFILVILTLTYNRLGSPGSMIFAFSLFPVAFNWCIRCPFEEDSQI